MSSGWEATSRHGEWSPGVFLYRNDSSDREPVYSSVTTIRLILTLRPISHRYISDVSSGTLVCVIHILKILQCFCHRTRLSSPGWKYVVVLDLGPLRTVLLVSLILLDFSYISLQISLC